ncbi:MAG: hypothetical protein WCG20_02105 [bacterium]
MNHENMLAPNQTEVETEKAKLLERHAALALSNDHLANLEELFSLSREFRKLGMLDKARELLAEAEALEKTEEFQKSMNDSLNVVAGTNADTIRKYTAAAALENKN